MRRLKSRRKREGVRLSRAVPVDPADRRVAVTRPRWRSTRSQTDAGETILRKMVELAEGGDMRAAELVLSRIWPARKGRPITLALPSIKNAADIVFALGAVADAVAAGDVTPDEGSAVANVLETKRRSIETADLERRIEALETEKQK